MSDEYRPWLDSALARARAYLFDRQCANGGFSFYRTDYLEEPDPSDTWHALAALSRLGVPPPRPDAVVGFFTGLPMSPQPYGLYFRTRVFDLLSVDDPVHRAVVAAVTTLPIEVPLMSDGDEPCPRLERLRLTLWLKRRFGLAGSLTGVAQAIESLQAIKGGFGAPPNLIDTRMALSCLALCDAMPPEGCGRFVASLAMPGFGFRLTEHSLSPTLDTVCAGVACSRRLDIAIALADDALVSILDCQTGDGGFARAPGALPGIRSTHLAVIGLETLAGLLSRPTGDQP